MTPISKPPRLSQSSQAEVVIAAYLADRTAVNTFALTHPRAARLRPSSGALLGVVCLAQFMVILDVSIVNVALPSIRDSLHFSVTGLQWVVNAYTLTFAGFLMLGGRASDPAGPPPRLSRRHRAVRPRLAGVRTQRQPQPADRGSPRSRGSAAP